MWGGGVCGSRTHVDALHVAAHSAVSAGHDDCVVGDGRHQIIGPEARQLGGDDVDGDSGQQNDDGKVPDEQRDMRRRMGHGLSANERVLLRCKFVTERDSVPCVFMNVCASVRGQRCNSIEMHVRKL